MSLKLSGNNSLSYIGVEPLQPPNLVYIKRDPISGAVQNADWRQFNVGTFWLNPLNNTLWILVKKELNIPLWIQLGITASGFLQTLTSDDAVTVAPIGLNINIFGDDNITTFGTIGTATIQVTLNDAISVTNITVAGDTIVNNFTVTGPITTNLSQGVVQSPGAGMALFASLGGNGQVLISGGPGFQPAWGNLTSADATVVITNGIGTIDLSVPGGGGGGGTLNTLTGNNGIATAAAGNINVTTDNTTVLFVGSSDDLLLDFDSADRNLLFGSNFIGGPGTATDNTAMGSLTLFQLTNGDRNSALGSLALTAITTGSDNTAIGNNAGQALIAGNNNIALGSNSGTAWVNNSDNIAIGNAGDPGDAGAMKLGTDGTHTSVFVQGITGPVPTPQMVTVDPTTGQLGRQAIPSGSGSSLTTILTVGSGTFNKSLAPLAATIEVLGWSGGGGGGSGQRGVSGSSGGGGGGATGPGFYFTLPGSFLANSTPYTVGAGGVGGASRLVDNSLGQSGATGQLSFFGNMTVPNSGATGGGGGINGGSPGGTSQPCFMTYGGSFTGNGGSGGSGSTGTGNAGGDPSLISQIPTCGGGGGGAGGASNSPGGRGGNRVNATASTIVLAGGAGGSETGTINGSPGTAAMAAALNYFAVGGTGGGGGGGQRLGGVAGIGGVGGVPGGGGGGGGGSINGTNSGAGGAGGAGLIIVIEHF